jgi:perosamine synthetase
MTPSKKKSSSPIENPTPEINRILSLTNAKPTAPNSSFRANPISEFEEFIETFTRGKYAVAVSSLRASLLLCAQVADIEPGDLVITTPFASSSSTEMLISKGAVPIFVDVEPRSGNIDPHLVFAATQDIMFGGKNTQAWLPPKGSNPEAKLKAILPVDSFGQPADMELILNTAWKYKIKVIEDASAALGASYKGHQAGALGDYGVLSFHPDPHHAESEVGVVITDEPDAANTLFSLRDQPMASPLAVKDESQSIDYHPDSQVVMRGLLQMQHLEGQIAKSNRVADWFNLHLAKLPGVQVPPVANYASRVSWFTYRVLLAPGINRNAITQKLQAMGIQAHMNLSSIHLQADIVERFGYRQGTFPVAEDLALRSLVLPFSCEMDEATVQKVCQALAQAIQ